MTSIEGGVTAPEGFKGSGVHAGIKNDPEKLDCSLILSDTGCTIGGTFTRNLMKSPPVFWNIDRCALGTARGMFINSGNANAATGDQGKKDVIATAELIAKAASIRADEICICSTGVIGVTLPMDKIESGVKACVDALSLDGGLDAAKGIMTTDTVPKERAVEFQLYGKTVRIGAIAKGSGMILPNMATMICILTTDAAIPSAVIAPMLKKAVDISFNQIGIDNDMSTSDTVMLFANGQSGAPDLTEDSQDYALFSRTLTELCQDMAKDLVKDGEGATKFVEISVTGPDSNDDAKTIARAIGNSMLCKTAFFGQDPNWGRFAAAVGYAGVNFDPERLTIALNDVVLCKNGIVAEYREEDAADVMLKPEFTIHVSTGSGSGSAKFWTSDLSHDYVSINADYRS